MKEFKITKFKITKEFKRDKNNEVLIIKIEQTLNKNQWKNRYLLFNSETATYKAQKGKQK